jgi:tetratricopeptide (TPR) repeat protein
MIFAVHPLSSEVLGWASALPDALAVCAGLLAAVASGPMGALVATLCALLSKEAAVLILPALVAAGLVQRRLLWGWLAAIGLWAALRVGAGAGASWDWADRLHLVPAALLWPIYSMVIPHPLTAVRDLLSVPATVSVIGAGLLGIALVVGRRHRGAWAGIGLILAAAMIALPPTLDGYLAAERYAYVGLVGLSVFLAATLPVLDRRILGGLCVFGIGLQVHHSQRWQADASLFAAATEAMPTSSFSWHLLGHALAQSGRFSEAADAFGEAITTGHPYPDDAQLRLIALVQSGRAGEAVAWAEAGPREGLTADWIAWWARAAHDTGDVDRTRTLLEMLYSDPHWDGPAWVPELAAQVQTSP